MRVRFVRLLQKNINISLSVDIYTTESPLTAVVSSYHAGVLHCCRSAGAHSRPLCLQELLLEKEAVSSELLQDWEDLPCSRDNPELNETLPMATQS